MAGDYALRGEAGGETIELNKRDVIVEIKANSIVGGEDRDLVRKKLWRGANARQEKELWRAKGSAGNYDFA